METRDDRIRTLRNTYGLSTVEIGRRVGLSPSRVSQIAGTTPKERVHSAHELRVLITPRQREYLGGLKDPMSVYVRRLIRKDMEENGWKA